MRRVFSFVIVIALALSCLSVASFASDEPAIMVSTTTAKPGDTVSVTVTMSNNPGIVNLTIPIE